MLTRIFFNLFFPFMFLLASCSFASPVKHVIVISVDGLRPDAISAEKSPVIQKMKTQGAYASKARTIPLSKTLPSHTSMLTGRSWKSHKVSWNTYDVNMKNKIKAPTCLQIAKDNGLSSAMFVGKEKFKHLHEQGATYDFFWPGENAMPITQKFLDYEKEKGLPNLTFIHYPEVDYAGHGFGWMSKKYFVALKGVDDHLASIVELINSPKYANNTILILTSDHGGKGKTHGEDIPVHRNIPWLAYGGLLKAGWTFNEDVMTYDTAATAMSLLGLRIPKNWEGKALVLPLRILPVPTKVAVVTKAPKKS